MNIGNSSSETKECPYCRVGTYHLGAICPKVKALEYYADGTLKRVEFKDEKA